MDAKCGCGTPIDAAYYWQAIIGRDVPGGTETSEVDGYACALHCPSENEIADRFDSTPDPWYCLRVTVTPIPGRD